MFGNLLSLLSTKIPRRWPGERGTWTMEHTKKKYQQVVCYKGWKLIDNTHTDFNLIQISIKFLFLFFSSYFVVSLFILPTFVVVVFVFSFSFHFFRERFLRKVACDQFRRPSVWDKWILIACWTLISFLYNNFYFRSFHMQWREVC